MLRFGIMGLNEGNGHPYSFSAIFNGYDESALAECPFAAIRAYLPAIHQNRHIIPDARVTHVWTQDAALSQRVARLAKIPNVAGDYRDMLGEVDGLILARDDPRNHWEMARPFIEAGVPVYLDKVLADTMEDYRRILAAVGEHGLLMAGSPSRFTPAVRKAKQEIDPATVRSVHGISCVNWIRYANHLLDGIAVLFGTDFKTVQNIGDDDCDVVRLVYRNGLNVVLEVIEGTALPIEFTCRQKSGGKHIRVPFADESDRFESYFWGFYNMLEAFTRMVKTGQRPAWHAETLAVSRAVIGGGLSRQRGGIKIDLDSLE
jgi:predicted dehydrogenase